MFRSCASPECSSALRTGTEEAGERICVQRIVPEETHRCRLRDSQDRNLCLKQEFLCLQAKLTGRLNTEQSAGPDGA